MSHNHRWSIAIAAALLFAAPASAQQIPTGDVGVAPITASMRAAEPVFTLAPTLAFESSAAVPAAPVPPAMRQSQSVALMIVGVAGMVVGSLIDGDTGTIIMVGGGVAGLIGLFQYLN